MSLRSRAALFQGTVKQLFSDASAWFRNVYWSPSEIHSEAR